MDTIKLSDINLLDFGNEIQIAGIIWTGKGFSFTTQFPDKTETFENLKSMPLTLEEWQKLLRQTDLLETEILANDGNGIVKKIVRKTARQIDSYTQWSVWRRDNFACRYCGRDTVPLTVDHIDLWEEGGCSLTENMLSACKNCNKDRGRMKYDEWINSARYKNRSSNLTSEQRKANEDVIDDLAHLYTLRVTNIRSR